MTAAGIGALVSAARQRADLLALCEAPGTILPLTPRGGRWMLDNVSCLPLTTPSRWLASLSQEARRNVRLAARRGVAVERLRFTPEAATELKAIYDETPLRQGRIFPHFGKPLASVHEENSTYAERSVYLAARLEGEMCGFLKMVRVGSAFKIMQILALQRLRSHRVMNALIAAAVEEACAARAECLIYCRHYYGRETDHSLTVFKERNGFRALHHRRLFLPLTLRGRLGLLCGLHRSLRSIAPPALLRPAFALRSLTHRLRVESMTHVARPSGP